MRLRRGRAGQAPHPRNERLPAHCPPLVCRSLAARRAGFPVGQVKPRKTGKPTPVLAGRQPGQVLKPHLPQRLKDGVTARASSPRVLAASGCGPRQGLDPLSVPNGCAAHWLFRQYRDRRRCGSARKGGQGVGAARSRLRRGLGPLTALWGHTLRATGQGCFIPAPAAPRRERGVGQRPTVWFIGVYACPSKAQKRPLARLWWSGGHRCALRPVRRSLGRLRAAGGLS